VFDLFLPVSLQEPQQQQQQEEESGEKDVILVTDADTPTGELVVLQLILLRWGVQVQGYSLLLHAAALLFSTCHDSSQVVAIHPGFNLVHHA
jgi:hypothetical protein